MEPQDNKKLALSKAVSAHEQAEAALNDLMREGSDSRYEAMAARIRQNLEELRADAATSAPTDRV